MLVFFFFNDTATTEIYTLSLHDALPISDPHGDRHLGAVHAEGHGGQLVAPFEPGRDQRELEGVAAVADAVLRQVDRKSTRLNSSHANISYAVFCLKKKKKYKKRDSTR